MAGDSIEVRNRIIEFQCFEKLIYISKTCEREQLLKNVAWALSNLLRGKPAPQYESVKPVYKVLLDYRHYYQNIKKV